MSSARPALFPALRRVTRAEAARARGLVRRLCPDGYGPRRLDPGAAWTALLGGGCWARPETPRVGQARALAEEHADTALGAVFSLPGGEALVALIDRPLASGVMARVLGEAVSLREPLSAMHEGTLIAWIARVAMAAAWPAPPPIVRGVTDVVAEALEALGREGRDDLVVWPWRVTAGALAGRVTVCVSGRSLGPHAPPGPLSEALGDVGVWGRWVVARSASTGREVAGLGVGDVLLTGALEAAEEGWTGPVSLCFGDGVALPLTRRHDGAVVITGPAGPPPRLDMHPDNDRPAVPASALGEIPVEVTVDLGHTSFPLHEVARWRVGEVVEFPQRVDAGVTVRAGGRVVARGELVDVEGRVGVSLTEVLP